jgi:hypothetical protein
MNPELRVQDVLCLSYGGNEESFENRLFLT